MKRSLALHSYKGGTGKSSIAANLAVIYAKKGLNVCLLDYDFRAPSLQVLFKADPTRWLNDFLEGTCGIEETVMDLTEKYSTKGSLLVGFANPSSKTMREMMTKDRKWEMKALHRTLSAKSVIYNDLKVNVLIFDTSPGMYYSSINALAGSDAVALIMKMDEFDLEGTRELISGIYDVLGRKTGILLNKITGELTSLEGWREKLTDRMEKTFNLPILGIIPCYCDVLATGGRVIYAYEKPEHPFTRAVSRIAEKLEGF